MGAQRLLPAAVRLLTRLALGLPLLGLAKFQSPGKVALVIRAMQALRGKTLEEGEEVVEAGPEIYIGMPLAVVTMFNLLNLATQAAREGVAITVVLEVRQAGVGEVQALLGLMEPPAMQGIALPHLAWGITFQVVPPETGALGVTAELLVAQAVTAVV